ncbi:hypothetical protein ABIC83_002916 [Roseateles asaccharophilus]|uniref:ATP-binding protein n=1 Tax=Roseateles asaccharophilus TaxID=582607 RepID=UPI003833B8F8
MTFQLRQMVLVNAGTNKKVPSGRITQIDPRGGAAVVGANAVGKTFTLRLIPLFFGHAVSDVVAHGQEGMKFILPTSSSAILFEYQRGSGDDVDIRLAVMRPRTDGADAPMYRIYKTPFRKDLFLDGTHYFTDAETEAMAEKLGIEGTKQLTTSDYRAVILRTESHTKDRAKIHRYGLEYSFGPRRMPNLDKLVAAMVKNRVDFDQLVQVAVGMIQDELGRGADRNKVSIKQQKSAIDRWLRNHGAVVDAKKMEPRMTALSGMCLDHRTAEQEFRELHADVDTLTKKRKAEQQTLQDEVTRQHEARAEAVQAQDAVRKEMSAASAAASAKAAEVATAYSTALGTQQHYEKNEVEAWSTRVDTIPTLRLQRDGIAEQIRVASAAAANATHEYRERWTAVESESGARIVELEASKSPHREALESTENSIAVMEREAREACDQEANAKKESLAQALEPMYDKRGELKGQLGNPQVPEELAAAEANAADQIASHALLRSAAGNKLEAASKEARRIQGDYDALERSHADVKRRVETLKRNVEVARARLAPKDGTLLSALRAHGDESWKRNLARVIDPALLERADLTPQYVEDALTDAAYGWVINHAAIAEPEWADDNRMRAAVAEAERVLEAAVAELADVEAKLKACNDKLTAANRDRDLADAEVSILHRKASGLQEALQLARLQIGKSKDDAKKRIAGELSVLEGKIADLGQQLKGVDMAHGNRKSEIRQVHQRLKEEAVQRRDVAIAAIDKAIKEVRAESAARIESIKAQLNEHLSANGVDVKALNALTAQCTALDREISTLKGQEATVEAWRKWMAAGGPNEVARLKLESAAAAIEAERLAGVLSAFNEKCMQETKAFDLAQDQRSQALNEIIRDLRKLDEIVSMFGDYGQKAHEAFDPRITADRLCAKVEAQRKELNQSADKIKSTYRKLYGELTAQDSTVKEMFETTMAAAEGDDVTLAHRLVTEFGRMGPQVIGDLNNTLRTALNQIGHFSSEIATFESEVGRFNGQLQEGLKDVRCFERISNLRLDIVTDFGSLGYYRRLKRMDDVVRYHQAEQGKDYNTDLPPNSTVEAMRDFASILENGVLEVNLSRHIDIHGSVEENGTLKHFNKPGQLEAVSSNGLTTLILIALLVGLVNTVRRKEPVHIPWVTDEVGKFDSRNFAALLEFLRENRIDVITAAPELGVAQLGLFANRYLFEDRGKIGIFKGRSRPQVAQATEAAR